MEKTLVPGMAACLILAVAAASGCSGKSDLDGSDTSEDPGVEADGGLDVPDGSDVSGGSDEEEGRVPAGALALEDLNPLSPTFGTERSVSEEVGKVLVVYFANYT